MSSQHGHRFLHQSLICLFVGHSVKLTHTRARDSAELKKQKTKQEVFWQEQPYRDHLERGTGRLGRGQTWTSISLGFSFTVGESQLGETCPLLIVTTTATAITASIVAGIWLYCYHQATKKGVASHRICSSFSAKKRLKFPTFALKRKLQLRFHDHRIVSTWFWKQLNFEKTFKSGKKVLMLS